MILQVEQVNKELYEANFKIRRGNNMAGMINIKGTPGRMEADGRIEIFGKSIFLSDDKNSQIAAGRERRLNEKEKAYRTYLINGGRDGSICQVERKTGVFSSTGFREMIFGNEVIFMYARTFKTEGKNSVYCQDKQIAQIDTLAEIVDDMHHYTVYAIDQKGAEIAVLYCAYMYILTGFKPGQKIIKGTYKQASVSFDKTFDEKYDPDFIRGIEM